MRIDMVDETKTPHSPGERLRDARLKAGFSSAAAAARRFGWVYSTYVGHENGSRLITRDAGEEYSQAFKMTLDYLMRGKGRSPIRQNKTDNKSLSMPKEIYIFSTTDVQSFRLIRDGSSPESEKMTTIQNVTGLLSNVPAELPKRLYALHQPDRSMVQDVHPSIPPGTTVLIDPDRPPEPAEIAHAVIMDRQDSVIRRLKRVNVPAAAGAAATTAMLLEPLNKAFEDIILNESGGDFIVGRVYAILQLL